MRKLLFIVCLYVFTTSAHAQLKLSYGPKAGLNLSTVHHTIFDFQKVRPGLHIGGFLNLRFNKWIALQPELFYSMQGTLHEMSEVSEDGNFTGNTIKNKTKLDYLQIPLMFKFYPISGLYLEAGPQFGILVNAKYDAPSSQYYDNCNIRDLTKKGDIGLGIGAGYEFRFGLMAGYRYTHGFMDTIERGIFDDAAQNKVHQITFGWNFRAFSKK